MTTDEMFYRFDDVTVDCKNFRVQKGGQNITLTPRAFDVLLVLIKTGGRVVEKQEIFDRVWKETFVGDNALTKIIKEIRHALDDDANNPRYIETVPKRGYLLIAEVQQQDSPNRMESAEQPGKQFVAQAPRESIPHFKASKSQPTTRKNFLLVGIIVMGLLILAVGLFVFRREHAESIAKNMPIDSIAVLPFENASQDPNVEYLSDGITESLINRLSHWTTRRTISTFGASSMSANSRIFLTCRAKLCGRFRSICVSS
jgi:DNA-binding winged helix-turn-helix (wHTH) protein